MAAKAKKTNTDPYTDSTLVNSVPVTAHMVLVNARFESSISRYCLDEKPVHFVRMVAQAASMRDVSPRQTIVYLSDTTGVVAAIFSNEGANTDKPLTAKQRVQEEEEDILDAKKKATYTPMEAHDVPLAQRHIDPDVYYDVRGYLTWQRQKRGMPRSHAHLCVTHARRVTDMNQITAHMLECIHTHLLMTRGPLPRAAASDDALIDVDGGEECLDDDFF